MAKELKIKNIENMALFYLERFPTSKGHFQKVMQRKIKRKCEKRDIPYLPEYNTLLNEVTEKMERFGYLDDTRYINSIIKSSLNKGQSVKKIQAKLFAKSVDPDKIAHALDSYREENDINLELAAGVKFLRKKKIGCYATDYAPEEDQRLDPETKQKWLQKLAMGGFNYHTATQLLDLSEEEAETILDQSF